MRTRSSSRFAHRWCSAEAPRSTARRLRATTCFAVELEACRVLLPAPEPSPPPPSPRESGSPTSLRSVPAVSQRRPMPTPRQPPRPARGPLNSRRLPSDHRARARPLLPSRVRVASGAERAEPIRGGIGGSVVVALVAPTEPATHRSGRPLCDKHEEQVENPEQPADPCQAVVRHRELAEFRQETAR